MLATSVTHTHITLASLVCSPYQWRQTHLMEQVMDTLSDIDEALTYLNQVPVDERGAAWRAYLDAVLDQRKESEN
jgi:hypothetical protein